MAIFGVSKKEVEELHRTIAELQAKVAPEYKELDAIRNEISELKTEKKNLETSCKNAAKQLNQLFQSVKEKEKQIIQLDDEILLQDYALYKPTYDFASSDEYKDRLSAIRQEQKEMIKQKTACHFSTNWTVDGSKAKGQKMTNDNIKQILRSFNTECENAIDRVKYNNVESMRNRIKKSFEALNKLNESIQVSISYKYYCLKLDELVLAVEYAMKKQEEKEAARQAREELREQQKLEAEIRAAREKIRKEQVHFKKALKQLNDQLNRAEDSERAAIEEKRQELLKSLGKLDEESKVIDYREQNAKAGYVYIISNVGSFGENVYKIGMTRRLEPQDRVDELGDASVPFRFDVHAMIFSEDAPKLENALHKAFENKRVNMVNQRKEFFNVTLDEIKKVVKDNFDKTVDFISLPEADQYRQSIAMKESR